jgi:hypothetical protein
MVNAFNDKRQDERIPGEKLPQQVRTLKVTFGDNGISFQGKTIDASTTGISFKIELPVYSIQEYNLTITADDSSFTLHDELVSANPIDRETSRVSVHFTKQPDLEKYSRLIDSARRGT